MLLWSNGRARPLLTLRSQKDLLVSYTQPTSQENSLVSQGNGGALLRNKEPSLDSSVEIAPRSKVFDSSKINYLPSLISQFYEASNKLNSARFEDNEDFKSVPPGVLKNGFPPELEIPPNAPFAFGDRLASLRYKFLRLMALLEDDIKRQYRGVTKEQVIDEIRSVVADARVIQSALGRKM